MERQELILWDKIEKEINNKGQLMIKRVGGIITFRVVGTDLRYFLPLRYMVALCMGRMAYVYASVYKPRKYTPKNKVLKELL